MFHGALTPPNWGPINAPQYRCDVSMEVVGWLLVAVVVA
jgi:hypothetical protein